MKVLTVSMTCKRFQLLKTLNAKGPMTAHDLRASDPDFFGYQTDIRCGHALRHMIKRGWLKLEGKIFSFSKIGEESFKLIDLESGQAKKVKAPPPQVVAPPYRAEFKPLSMKYLPSLRGCRDAHFLSSGTSPETLIVGASE